MKYNKVLFILFLPLAINFVGSCCICLETMYSDYTNCSLVVQNLDNAGPEAKLTAEAKVLKEAFGLRLQVQRREDICLKTPAPFLMTSAFATSCDCGPEQLFQPLDSLVSVSIKTLNDFDALHPAGSDISNYFNVLQSIEFFSIPAFIDQLQNDFADISQADLTFDLLLMTPPIKAGNYQFLVEVQLSDGRLLSEVSHSVELL